MKKRLGVLGGLLLVTLLTLTFAGTALAQPPTPNAVPRGYGVGFLDRVTLTRVADLLGITAENLAVQLQEGKTLAEIAQAQGVTEGALTEAILVPFKDRLALQVKYGYLTQEQADARLQYEEARVEELISTTSGPYGDYGRGYGGDHGWGCPMYGGWGGFGGMMGGFGRWGMMGWW